MSSSNTSFGGKLVHAVSDGAHVVSDGVRKVLPHSKPKGLPTPSETSETEFQNGITKDGAKQVHVVLESPSRTCAKEGSGKAADFICSALRLNPPKEMPEPAMPWDLVVCACLVAAASSLVVSSWQRMETSLGSFEQATSLAVDSLRLSATAGLRGVTTAAKAHPEFNEFASELQLVADELAAFEISVAGVEGTRASVWQAATGGINIVLAICFVVALLTLLHALFVRQAFRSGLLQQLHGRFPAAGSVLSILMHVLTIAGRRRPCFTPTPTPTPPSLSARCSCVGHTCPPSPRASIMLHTLTWVPA